MNNTNQIATFGGYRRGRVEETLIIIFVVVVVVVIVVVVVEMGTTISSYLRGDVISLIASPRERKGKNATQTKRNKNQFSYILFMSPKKRCVKTARNLKPKSCLVAASLHIS